MPYRILNFHISLIKISNKNLNNEKLSNLIVLYAQLYELKIQVELVGAVNTHRLG